MLDFPTLLKISQIMTLSTTLRYIRVLAAIMLKTRYLGFSAKILRKRLANRRKLMPGMTAPKFAHTLKQLTTPKIHGEKSLIMSL